MAYSSGSRGDTVHLLRRTITGLADFSGRSRRTEVFYYWIASALVSGALSFAVGIFTSFETSMLFGSALRLVLVVPMFALFVRRLHDQDKSGWWGLLLPLFLLLSLPSIVAQFRGDIAGMIALRGAPMGTAAELCALAALVLGLWPETEGPNRYGPDPRLEEA